MITKFVSMYAAADSRQICLCYVSIAKCILLRIGAFIEIAQYCLFSFSRPIKRFLSKTGRLCLRSHCSNVPMENEVGPFCDEGISLGMILWVGQGTRACRSNLSIVISRSNLSIETAMQIHTATRVPHSRRQTTPTCLERNAHF